MECATVENRSDFDVTQYNLDCYDRPLTHLFVYQINTYTHDNNKTMPDLQYNKAKCSLCTLTRFIHTYYMLL